MAANDDDDDGGGRGLVRWGADLARARVAVIAVHGRDQDPSYLIEHLIKPLADADLGPRRELADVAWLLPSAPDRSWYPGRYNDPLPANQPHLDRSLAALSRARDLVAAAGLGPEVTVWVGFSQGACLVLEYQLRHPERWRGVAALTGAVLGPADGPRSVAGSLAGVPCYLGVGDDDPWMPPAAAETAARVLRSAGADVTAEVFASNAHEIRPAEVAAVADLIDRA